MSACICGAQIVQLGKGRPRKYCKDACRLRAQREGVATQLANRFSLAGMVLCTACGVAKGASEFNAGKRYAGGLQSWCRPCYREYRSGRRGLVRQQERAAKYGLSHAEQDALFKSQDGRCAACRDEITLSAHLDHNHATGKVRGFLCANCNILIGYAKEDRARLLDCADYLERHGASVG